MRSLLPVFLLSALLVSTSAAAQYVSVTDSPYNAAGDGTTDDTQAIQNALDSESYLEFPAGTYMITDTLQLNSDSWIKGPGTILQSGTVGNQAVDGSDVNNVVIQDLVIQGNLDADYSTNRHALRFGGNCQNIILRNLEVHDADGYGIGFEADGGDASFENIFLEDVLVDTANLDGIDFKNNDNANANITLLNVTVLDHGQSSAVLKSGIDIRGPATVIGAMAPDKQNGVITHSCLARAKSMIACAMGISS